MPDDPTATAASVSLEDWRFDTEGSLTHALCGSVYEVPPCSLTRLLALTKQHVCPVTADTAAGQLPAYYEAVATANEAILRLGDFPEFNGFDFDALVGALREAGRRSQQEAKP